jgi:hypothetical protein
MEASVIDAGVWNMFAILIGTLLDKEVRNKILLGLQRHRLD